MKASLSYPYVGTRFQSLCDTVVVVKDIAELADIPYDLLKNRMGMKRNRANSLLSVFISDSDLQPRRNSSTKRASRKAEIASHQAWVQEWLSKPIVKNQQ
jgi:hypothetical protein|tara:strand:- start:41 stop:340 length:300 start_codon:yes stop_codon:yes gene_type:complete